MVTTFTFVTKITSFHMITTVTMGAVVTSFKVPVLTKVKMLTGFCGYINMAVVSISADSFYLEGCLTVHLPHEII
jgi:hypothetical protein